ncbi:hypothetical protein E1A91_D05G340300v1 [Gossypium mustelinum]|uniref:Uncharacterized protein n=2 Tax=Gossypium TaxID=3633 RepID=A0A5D2V425_GOSMU|nr:hypothetical protein ES332_D05G352200v1 [Gossypium tomentosum]TYI84099.1 hypothetical protein E1A91_D05G340300v1 [Gossypium mustelinum]
MPFPDGLIQNMLKAPLTRNEIDGLEVLMAAVTPSAGDDDDEKSMAGALIDLQGQ